MGFRAGDSDLYRYAGNDATNATDPTGLYELDIHYYMTLHLALAVGIPEEDAEEIAWAAKPPITIARPSRCSYSRRVES